MVLNFGGHEKPGVHSGARRRRQGDDRGDGRREKEAFPPRGNLRHGLAKNEGVAKIWCMTQVLTMKPLDSKETAEAFLGHEVHDAVVTVPAYFNDSQRQVPFFLGQN